MGLITIVPAFEAVVDEASDSSDDDEVPPPLPPPRTESLKKKPSEEEDDTVEVRDDYRIYLYLKFVETILLVSNRHLVRQAKC